MYNPPKKNKNPSRIQCARRGFLKVFTRFEKWTLLWMSRRELIFLRRSMVVFGGLGMGYRRRCLLAMSMSTLLSHNGRHFYTAIRQTRWKFKVWTYQDQAIQHGLLISFLSLAWGHWTLQNCHYTPPNPCKIAILTVISMHCDLWICSSSSGLYNSGWWFQTCLVFFPFHIWDNPSHWRTHIFQDGYPLVN